MGAVESRNVTEAPLMALVIRQIDPSRCLGADRLQPPTVSPVLKQALGWIISESPQQAGPLQSLPR
jgi:hypothetical protein